MPRAVVTYVVSELSLLQTREDAALAEMAAAQNPVTAQDTSDAQDARAKSSKLPEVEERAAVPLGYSKSKYNQLMSSHRKAAQVNSLHIQIASVGHVFFNWQCQAAKDITHSLHRV